MRICPGILLIALAGCASARTGADFESFPLNLAGDNAQLHFQLDPTATGAADHSEGLLADQEFCYLAIDKVTIECFPFGSLLMLGPDDAIELVSDNPLDDLHPGARDPGAETLLRTLAIVSLIATSVDRMPDSLADYIDDDNAQNPGVARALAHLLLQPGGTKISGFSGSGTFTIAVELTDTGKETLEEALADRQTTAGRLVHARAARPRHSKPIIVPSAFPWPRVWR